MCAIGHPHNYPPLESPTFELIVKIIEFTHNNVRFAIETLTKKTTKYQPLINNITTRGWNVAPLMF